MPAPSNPEELGRIGRDKQPSVFKFSPYVRPLSKKIAGDRFNKIESAVKELKDLSDRILVPDKEVCKEVGEFDLFGQFCSFTVEEAS